MNLIRKMFSKRNEYETNCVPISGTRHIEKESDLNFRVYKANGGIVLESSSYDRSSCEHKYNLYVIKDDDELTAKISKIITMVHLNGV